ncbi:MAG: methyl-accepting chemotaxis protein [Deltaproteobacteria bacterium]|nr:methyl-accepting chemotaxis protein [Deltaproteobacteria bacterium]MCL5277672.1 methyl-accepting chemotaxis protein [Deltaproteobacteria bacterium]
MFTINIKVKITLLVAGLLLLLEAAQLIIGWYNLQTRFVDTISKQAVRILQQQAGALSSQLVGQSATTTAGTITQTVTASSLESIKGLMEWASSVDLFAPDGSVIASTEETTSRMLREALSGYLKMPKQGIAAINGRLHRYFVSPVTDSSGTTVAYIVITLSDREITASIWDVFQASVWTAILSSIAMIFITYLFMAVITRPVAKLLSHTKQVGSGDLTHAAKTYSTDEFSILTHAFNDTTSKLRDVIVKIKDVTQEAVGMSVSLTDTYGGLEKASSEEISGLKAAFSSIGSTITAIDNIANTMEGIVAQYSDLSSALNQFTGSIGEVDNSAERLTVSIGDISISIEEIISSIKEVSNNIGELSKYIEESNSSIHEIRSSTKEISEHSMNSSSVSEAVVNESMDGLRSADAAIDGIGRIKQTTDGIVASITMLVKSSNQIAEVLDSINQIADKTNLLALNAAIIANQAGEHGKGFAVVAQEISELAERTRISTTEIDRIVKSINSEMQKAKLAADAGTRAVEEGVSLTRVTHRKLSLINDGIKSSHSVTMSIEKMIKEQSIAITTIAEAQEMISKVSKQILAAMNDQVSGTSQINQTVEGIKALTNKLRMATSEQTKSIQLIAKNADTTMHSITNVNQTLGIQRQENKAAVTAIGSSVKNIEENVGRVQKTKALLLTLKERLGSLRDSVEWFKLG